MRAIELTTNDGGLKGPGFILVVSLDEIGAAGLGSPKGNIAATKLFGGLLALSFRMDAIQPRRLCAQGNFDRSIYLIELEEADIDRAKAIATSTAENALGGFKFRIVDVDAAGNLHIDGMAHDAAAITECVLEASRAEREFNETQRAVLARLLKKVKELEREAREGEEWKDQGE